MFKVILGLVFKFAMLFLVAGVLTWLYGVFNNSPFFIFLVIVIGSAAYDRQSKEIQRLHERILKLEGFNR